MEIVLFFVWFDRFVWYLVFAMQHARTTQVNGTCLKGYVKTTFNKLVATFGEPCLNEGASEYEKVTIEWKLRFSDGTIATIYDWKCFGWQPLGDRMYEWHIGGHDSKAVELVKEELGIIYGKGPLFDLANAS
jgi:hypothetical protein